MRFNSSVILLLDTRHMKTNISALADRDFGFIRGGYKKAQGGLLAIIFRYNLITV
jgi:hypothetical protein